MTKRILFLHPFRPEFERSFVLLRRAIGATGEEVELARPASLSVDVFSDEIGRADLIVCDITDPNPNVMLELGRAQALKKPILLITASLESVPFDLRQRRLFRYGLDPGAADDFIVEFSRAISTALRDPARSATENDRSRRARRVFVSYSHNDREYLERLLVHLRPLENEGLIDLWVDLKLRAGDRWKEEIAAALAQARVALLLISADFLASNFIVNNELPPLLKSAEEAGTRMVPIILKPCRFVRDPNLNVSMPPTIPLFRFSCSHLVSRKLSTTRLPRWSKQRSGSDGGGIGDLLTGHAVISSSC